MTTERIKRILINRVISPVYTSFRIAKYWILSSCSNVTGTPIRICPVLLNGVGTVIFKKSVTIGVVASPYFYNTYCYIEARNSLSVVSFGDNVFINNNACFISEGEGIYIGADVLIGPSVTIFDSDFHAIDPLKRKLEKKTARVQIEDNVFIGANVTILKGVTIGKNSVIASNSLVSKSIPANVIAGGNPCKIIKEISV
ncbi:DapH/DapD/GlmU-related protein [Mucilaginibacter xinganensis]|uniref:DapH/DapD/GlmU-related protein n=1 Tax=Mucilaginibacter xinganensis TaxID=1234841 RepID=UPI000B9805E6|nr:DapH/DapD/GlmU-related protein [Mucilaginibacter xinganensis]